MLNKTMFLGFLLILAVGAASCKGLKQISGQVWQDNNGDGLKSSDEPWLSGVKVGLYNVGDDAAVEIESKETDKDGKYQFELKGSSATDLEIRVTAPNGAQFTKKDASTSEVMDSNVDTRGRSDRLIVDELDENKFVNAGVLAVSESADAKPEPEPEADKPDAPPTKAAEPTPTPTVEPAADVNVTTITTDMISTTTTITTPVSGPDDEVLTQRVVDGTDDPIDCQETMVVTNQDLTFDITGAGWQLVNNTYDLYIQFDGNLEELLESVGSADYFAAGWGLFDPQGEVVGEQNPTWLPTVSNNNSFDAIYDAATGAFVGTRFRVQDGTWTEDQENQYPVATAGSIITMTVPISDIAQNATGFAQSIHFYAEEGQLNCDWAGLDEVAYRKTLENLINTSEIIDPTRLVHTYELEIPVLDAEPASDSTSKAPNLSGTFLISTTVISGKVHEQFVNLDQMMNLTVTHDVTETQALHFDGPGAWVDVAGQLVDADYTMGQSGKLPGGEPIVFKVTGRKFPDGPPTIITDTLETTQVYSETVGVFIDKFNDAFDTQDIDYLHQNLHPAVIDLYGSDGCFNYLTEVIVNPISIEIVNLRGPEPWNWERDGHTILVPDAFTIDANLTFSGQTQPQEFHVALVNDVVAWFTDCGDPSP